ncbi:MAG: DUF3168 domain-containing protein [Gemmataceae bacterium]
MSRPAVNGANHAIAWFIETTPAVERLAQGGIHKGTSGQNEKRPYVCYHDQGSDVGHLLSGVSDGLPKARFQIEAWSQDDATCEEIGVAIKERIELFQREQQKWAGAVRVQAIKVTDWEHSDDPDPYGAENAWWRYLLNVEMDFEE